MNSMSNIERREKWKALIEEQEKSGLTRKEFCKRHNLSSSSLTYYLGVFRGKQPSKKVPGTFTPVSVIKSVPSTEIRLTLPNGFQCALPADLASTRIKELVEIFLSC
jgi:hypothetical protein